MKGSERSVSEARVVVGLDFGTTYSGYAFAHKSRPQDIFTYCEWEGAPPKPYSKTASDIYYKPAGFVTANGNFQYSSWGYPALAEFQRDSVVAARTGRAHSSAVVGTYLTRFKLHLADMNAGPPLSASVLPEGVTVNRVISDYLRHIGAHVLKRLQETFGSKISMEYVQWCVTVPSIWSNNAKRQMKECMIDAGLVTTTTTGGGRGGRGGGGGDDRAIAPNEDKKIAAAASPHPLIMVLEPEAASCHCHRSINHLKLQQGDKLLVADVGGGTTDIVVQEWVGDEDNFRVKEVTRSTGGLCGGTYVDQRFVAILAEKIDCGDGGLTQYFQRFPTHKTSLLRDWVSIKCTFGAMAEEDPPNSSSDHEEEEFTDIQLNQQLALAWEEHEKRLGRKPREVYDEIHLSYADMKRIFDPVVEDILELIEIQLSQTMGSITAIFVLGGFAASPYLMGRIREAFCDRVQEIVVPPNPGSAVCQGAVALALNPPGGGIVTRIARKTYGIEIMPDFVEGVDPLEYQVCVNGVKKCKNRMQVFVQKDAVVDVDQCVTKYFDVISNIMTIKLFSCDDETNPRYTTQDSCVVEGEIKINISQSLDLSQQNVGVQVSMYFGRSSIEVAALIQDNTETQRGRDGGGGGSGEVHQIEIPVTF
ncbi:unnamed protein product [Sphagnum jensenii]|jgi:hypothetical protein|uniref:Uncharacterized protein n=1 Tax=Sphagnum jensenii TaxID=128206 RepID=A0ABP0VV17_9BRYO